MVDVELLALDRHDWERVAADPTAFVAQHAAAFGVDIEVVRAFADQTLALLQRTGASLPWSCYLAVDRTLGIIVGTCGYVAPPDTDGMVEIAYFTFPAHEGRGYATSMSQGLVDRALAAPVVHCIRAHTLPERNASTRILEKLGFVKSGDAVDPDAGPVWRWEAGRHRLGRADQPRSGGSDDVCRRSSTIKSRAAWLLDPPGQRAR